MELGKNQTGITEVCPPMLELSPGDTSRATAGRWPSGVSGNSKGRPKDVRTLQVLKNDLELAVREKLNPSRVSSVVNRLLDIATSEKSTDKDAIAAGKVILDMAISKSAVQEPLEGKSGLKVIIETLTLQAAPAVKIEAKPIEVEFTEIENKTNG
jgi:hypothetical protein